jgi:hypothetical protein
MPVISRSPFVFSDLNLLNTGNVPARKDIPPARRDIHSFRLRLSW